MKDDFRIGRAGEDDRGEATLRREVERRRWARRERVRSLATVGALGLVAGGLAALASRADLPRQPASPAPLTADTSLAVDGPRVQVALLLDTSGSMDGLIDQARSQMWKVVNELAEARRDGQRPRIELALYEYGKVTVPSPDYVMQVLPFTTDLDQVSEQLFALTTNGGDEYCGAVIGHAARELAWSERPGDVHLVLIAGNEPFDQGPVPPAEAIAAAKRRGIVVNPVLCATTVDDPTWGAAAKLAGGQLVSIDPNHAVAHVDAPQDAEIARLGDLLNFTYVPYGARGGDSQARQLAQDANAAGVQQGAALQRSLCKASASYRNDVWDLVDATASGTVDLGKIPDADLPGSMRGLDAPARAAYVADKARQRSELQARIGRLNAERAAFVADRHRDAAGPSTLDVAVVRMARAEAERKGFTFPAAPAGAL